AGRCRSRRQSRKPQASAVRLARPAPAGASALSHGATAADSVSSTIAASQAREGRQSMRKVEDAADEGIELRIGRLFAAHEPAPELIVLAIEQPEENRPFGFVRRRPAGVEISQHQLVELAHAAPAAPAQAPQFGLFRAHAGIPRARQAGRLSPAIAGPGHSIEASVMAASASGTAPLQHQLLDLADGLGGIEPLRAGAGAVHDGVAAVELEGILQLVQARAGVLVAAVDDPAVGLQQDRRAEVALAVPPVARAAGRAAGAEDALVEAVELGAVFLRLQALA